MKTLAADEGSGAKATGGGVGAAANMLASRQVSDLVTVCLRADRADFAADEVVKISGSSRVDFI